MSRLTLSQIDRLAEKLRSNTSTKHDLELLANYRFSFGAAFEAVVDVIRAQLRLKPTGRRIKSTISISQKLRRESIRLSQMQDIAGCRVVVSEISAQNDVVKRLTELFDATKTFDRRKKPSHGYRAIHVIVKHDGTAVEVQVRTALQHMWAELSEKLSDIVDPGIKYGGGPEPLRALLTELSATITDIEDLEAQLLTSQARRQDPAALVQIEASLAESKLRLMESLESVIKRILVWKDN